MRKAAAPLPMALPAQGRSDRATLTLLTGNAAGVAFPLVRARPTTIGRAEEADIVLEDPAISRLHAEIL